MLYIALIQLNPIIILRLNGAHEVVQYTALSTIFFVPIILINLIGNSVWSRITRSVGKGDMVWANNTLDKVIWFAFITIMCTATVALTYTQFSKYWWVSTKPLVVEQLSIFVFFIYTASLIMQTALSNFACAVQKLDLQRRFYIAILVFKSGYFLVFQFFPTVNWSFILISDAVILIAYCVYQKNEIKNEFRKIR